jgi:hypothetical protein
MKYMGYLGKSESNTQSGSREMRQIMIIIVHTIVPNLTRNQEMERVLFLTGFEPLTSYL